MANRRLDQPLVHHPIVSHSVILRARTKATLTWCAPPEPLTGSQRAFSTTMAVPTLADITSATTESKDSETSDDDSDSIPSIFEEIGADMDRVRRFYDQRDSDDHDRLVRLAERLSEDDSAYEVLEEYRSTVDAHRLKLNFVSGEREGPHVEAWSHALYYGANGSKENPAEGSKNALEQIVRDDDDLNLPLYKVMFPEPVEEAFPGEPVNVVNHLDKWDEIGIAGEDGVQDSYIFMSREFCDTYMDYANDDGVPLPPAEHPDTAASGGDSGGSDDGASFDSAYDPSAVNVDQLKDDLNEIDDADLVSDILVAERTGDNRKTAKKAILKRLSDLA